MKASQLKTLVLVLWGAICLLGVPLVLWLFASQASFPTELSISNQPPAAGTPTPRRRN